uniref:Signal transducing adaptor family member 1 n=1 Tax=Sphenodon punctatus TaxID=8508 RepID=A0A8D0GR45_SPHPU
MEMPAKAPKPAPRLIFQERLRITALPLYYGGFLSVRYPQDQYFMQYWTELRGTTLFFYSDKKNTKYIDKLDLINLMSVADINPAQSSCAMFILMLPDEEVEIKIDDPERGEEWKSFILTVRELSVPPSGSLLPSQVTRLREVLARERKRRAALEKPPSDPFSLPVQEVPSQDTPHHPEVLYLQCFYAVSRKEAVEMLEKDPTSGNLILRPGSDCKNYSVTIRQVIDAPCIKHYRVVSTGQAYRIDVDKPVRGYFFVIWKQKLKLCLPIQLSK